MVGTSLGLPRRFIPQTAIGTAPASFMLLPRRQRMRGGIPWVITTQSTGGTAERMWGADGLYDATVIKNQIDWCAAIGLNTVCLRASCEGIANKAPAVTVALTRAQQIAGFTEILNYVAAKSPPMYVMVSFGNWPGNVAGATFDLSSYIAEMTVLGTLLKTYPNVIGVDVINELFAFSSAWGAALAGFADATTNGAYLDAHAAAMRAALTGISGWTIPISFSGVASGPGNTNAGWIAQGSGVWSHVSAWSDFANVHMYALNPPAGNLRDVFWNGSGAGAKIVIGEYGASEDLTAQAMQDEFNAMNAMLAVNGFAGERCAGGLVWTVGSNRGAVGSPNDWGMFDVDGTARTNKSVPVQGMPY